MNFPRALLLTTALACVSMACDKKDSAAPVPSGGIPITVDKDGFKPSSIKFPKGTANASLVFTRTSDDTCATEVEFPELKIKKELPKNTPVTVPIPTDKEQTLTFQCGMAMYKSSVVITAK